MLSTDFKEFIELLNFTQTEYMVIGVLGAFGFASLGLKESDFLVPEAVIQLGYPPARIDLLTAIDGVTFLDCYARRKLTSTDGVDMNVIDITDFKINKLAAGRHKDLADLEALNLTST